MDKVIYINGTGGLGNCLFQIAASLIYVEEYKYNIILNGDSDCILYGSDVRIGNAMKKNNIRIPYKDTIFKKLKHNSIPQKKFTIIDNSYNKHPHIAPIDSDILITGYCQHRDMFVKYLNKIPNYLYLEDPTIKEYIINKYGNPLNKICICLRIAKDFKHKYRSDRYIQFKNAYCKAIELLHSKGIKSDIYILSDIPNGWKNYFKLDEEYPAIEVIENDIVQFYFGIMCRNIILSESTYHMWIAYLSTILNDNTNIIGFKNTDLTKRNLYLHEWTMLDL